MAKKFYIGNLPYRLTDEELKEIFTPCGEVISAYIIRDKFDHRSKGFGFVEMADGVENVIETLNGKEIDGRAITVSEARERTESSAPRQSFENNDNYSNNQ